MQTIRHTISSEVMKEPPPIFCQGWGGQASFVQIFVALGLGYSYNLLILNKLKYFATYLSFRNEMKTSLM